jgi:hypothetical protein
MSEKYPATISREKILVLALVSEGAIFVLALAAARFFTGIDIFKNFGVNLMDIARGTLFALPALAGFIALTSPGARNLPVIGPLRKVALTDIKMLFAQSRDIDLVLISLIAGIAEEVAFRGVLQVKTGIIAASVIFGLLHFITPGYFAFATLMGLYLGALFSHYGNLSVPVVAHAVYDMGALLYLKHFTVNDDFEENRRAENGPNNPP